MKYVKNNRVHFLFSFSRAMFGFVRTSGNF